MNKYNVASLYSNQLNDTGNTYIDSSSFLNYFHRSIDKHKSDNLMASLV